MLALKSFLASLLRGGREPRHLFLAVVLGFTAGCVCGWNLTFAALVCSAALLNCSTTLLIASALCGSLAAMCATGATHSLGVLLLDKCGLGAQLAKLGSGPLVAMFRLDDYAVCGSLAAGLALSIPAAQVFSRFATHRRSLLNLTVARLTEAREPLFRPLGFAAATCCLMITGLLVQMQGPRLVREALLEHLSAALGTEVSADVVSYDLWTGDLHLTNLRISDADKPSDVALVVEGVSAQVEPGLLLRGRLACDEMTVAGLFCDPTKLSQTAPAGMFAKGPTLLKEDFAQPTHNEDPLRAVEVQGLVRNWSGVCDRLLVVERLVGFVEKIADLEATAATNHSLKKCLDRRRPQRDAISGALVPLAQVKTMKIERLPSSWKLSARSGLALTDLTSNPKLATRPAGLAFHDAERNVTLNTVFNLSSPERKHEVTLAAHGVEIESLLSSQATRSALAPLHACTTSVEVHGWVTRENLELELSTSLKGLQVTNTTGQFAGISAAFWQEGLQKLGALPIEGSLRGRWSNPRISIVPEEVVRDVKQKLADAGAHDLVKSFENRKPSGGLVAPSSAASTAVADVKNTSSPNAAKPSALQPAAAAPVATGLSSGIGAKTAATQPPTQPFTIQPMAMSGSLFPPTSSTSPNSPIVAPNTTVAAAQPSALQPAAAATTTAATSTAATTTAAAPTASPVAPISAETKAQTESLLAGGMFKPASPAQLTNTTQPPATALKTLPKDPFAVVPGQPWKEPTVVQGTLVPTTVATVAAKPQPASTQTVAAPNTPAQLTAAQPAAAQPTVTPPATASRYPIGIASDSVATKTADPSKPAVPAVQTPAASAGPTATPAQAAVAAKAPQPAGVAPIPTTLDTTAGLRQPLSVLDPNAAPGPINMTVGYDSDRTPAGPTAAAPKVAAKPTKPTMPAFEQMPQVSREPRTTTRDPLNATRPSAKPRVETLDPSADEPSEQVATKSAVTPEAKLPAKPSAMPAAKATATPKPARPPIADEVATNDGFEGEVPDQPATKRKSLLGNVSGWFGRGPKPETVIDRDVEVPATEQHSALTEEPKPAEKPKASKKFFSKLKSIFGETEVETLPPSAADRRVMQSAGDENDGTKVEPSSFDDATTEPKRAAASAEFTTEESEAEIPAKNAAAPRAAQQRAANEPRALNVPRTNLSNRGEPKPLAESAELTVTEKPAPPQPNDDAPAPTAKKPTTTARAAVKPTAPQPTERMSAGESFYNRMVR